MNMLLTLNFILILIKLLFNRSFYLKPKILWNQEIHNYNMAASFYPLTRNPALSSSTKTKQYAVMPGADYIYGHNE